MMKTRCTLHQLRQATFKYVEGGPDRKALGGSMKYQFVYLKARIFMLPADDMGVVRNTQKTQAPMSSAK